LDFVNFGGFRGFRGFLIFRPTGVNASLGLKLINETVSEY